MAGKLIILDRDGVINYDSREYVKSAAEWRPLPNSIEAIAKICVNNTVVIASNQSGLGRGLFTLDDLQQMHSKMLKLVEAAGGKIDNIYYCPHTPNDNCECRKPKPGLFNKILTDYSFAISDVYAVGDSLRDLQAAYSSGIRNLF